MKAKILFNDAGGRFVAGEIGTLLPNDYEKYDFFVALPSRAGKAPDFLGGGDIIIRRQYYFYADEVEVIK